MKLSNSRLSFLASTLLTLSLFQKLPLIPKYDVNLETLIQDNPTWGIAFRETQTLWGVRSAVRNGLDLFGLETPVLGPPFQIPFELPLFQNLAALFCSAFNLEVPFGSRLLALFFFTFTGFIYANLTKTLFGAWHSLSFCIFYCFTPFSFVWSTTALIESFTNFTLSLFFLFLYKYLNFGRSFFLFLSIISLIVTSFSKITTAFPLSFIVGYALILNITQSQTSTTLRKIRLRIPKPPVLMLIIAASTIPGFAWSRFADRKKESSFFTDWLTSSNLQTWNFGTLSQRLDVYSWLAIGGRLYLLIGVTILLIPILFFKVKSNGLELLLAMTILFPPLIYFNLYFVHDYYFMAILPFVCAAASVCISSLFKHLVGRKDRKLLYAPTFLVLIGLISTWLWTPGHDYKQHLNGSQLSSLNYIDFIKSNTRTNDLILTFGCDWNPAYLYLMDRKGLALPSRFNNLKEALLLVDKELGLKRFRYIVDCTRQSESGQFADLVNSNFIINVYPRVYLVSEIHMESQL